MSSFLHGQTSWEGDDILSTGRGVGQRGEARETTSSPVLQRFPGGVRDQRWGAVENAAKLLVKGLTMKSFVSYG